MSKNNYKDLVFPKKDEKKLDKEENVVYSNKTTTEVNPDYSAYAIVKLGPRKYVVAEVKFDSTTGLALPEVQNSKEYETEVRAIKELQMKLANQSKMFRKD